MQERDPARGIGKTRQCSAAGNVGGDSSPISNQLFALAEDVHRGGKARPRQGTHVRRKDETGAHANTLRASSCSALFSSPESICMRASFIFSSNVGPLSRPRCSASVDILRERE